ncbi:MAG: glycosyltransferase family 4 protein [Pseudomonadales bacterium]|jgi:glycosyltransferase involved in cell wall biosynthesis|nr:glycosyltransferase family 4 protein [Pseudomonadales bacterium]
MDRAGADARTQETSASPGFRPPHAMRPASSLRIALLGYRSNPYSGGQGIYIAALARALTDAGHRVDVISGPPYPELDDDLPLVRIPSLDLYAAPNHVTALRPRHFRSATDLYEYFDMLTGGFPEPYTFGRRLTKWMLERAAAEGRRYDLVHDNQSLCPGLLRLGRLGLPVVATIHHPIQRDRDIALAHASNWRARLLIRRWHRFVAMQERVVRRLPHLVTVSEASRTDIADAFSVPAERIEVIHNGIDVDTWQPLADVPRRDDLLVTVASADQPLKGLRYLLEAFARLVPQRPALRLVVVGRLREDGETKPLLARLGIGDRVEFRHGLSREALVRLYAEATLAVVPSLYEGFGLPAAEAMACGVPVISSRGGALPEVVGDAGLLVPPGDAPAIADAVTALLDDPGRRAGLGARGRRRVVEQFSWSVAARRLGDYYGRVLADRARSTGP